MIELVKLVLRDVLAALIQPLMIALLVELLIRHKIIILYMELLLAKIFAQMDNLSVDINVFYAAVIAINA